MPAHIAGFLFLSYSLRIPSSSLKLSCWIKKAALLLFWNALTSYLFAGAGLFFIHHCDSFGDVCNGLIKPDTSKDRFIMLLEVKK